MSTITVAWWWMLVALALIAVTGAVCGWVAYNWGWSHAAEDVHGRHIRPKLPSDFMPPPDALAPIQQLALLPAPVTQPIDHFKEPPPVGEAERKLLLIKTTGDFDCCEAAFKADDPSITTWTREQAEELDRAIKAMIADTDTFIAGLGGG
jgi:hypothetical protein